MLPARTQAVADLFQDAEKDWRIRAEQSPLHTIIFDEIDSVLRKRGGREDGGGAVRDGVVNVLLSKLDGLKAQGNVLVIGTTNRIDLIDAAALRPGRLEVRMELPLPDTAGREDILRIHTQRLLENSALHSDVLSSFGIAGVEDGDGGVLRRIAERHAVNFTGAELEGIVTNAASFALSRYVKEARDAAASSTADGDDVDHARVPDVAVCADDLLQAAAEISPLFPTGGRVAAGNNAGTLYDSANQSPGLLSAAFEACSAMAASVVDIHSSLKSSATTVGQGRCRAVALEGEPGVGRAALAQAVLDTNGAFSFRRVVDAAELVCIDVESARLHLSSIFEDAARFPEGAAIVLRDVDLLPAALRPVLLALLRRQSASEQRLLVIGTVALGMGTSGVVEGVFEDVLAVRHSKSTATATNAGAPLLGSHGKLDGGPAAS